MSEIWYNFAWEWKSRSLRGRSSDARRIVFRGLQKELTMLRFHVPWSWAAIVFLAVQSASAQLLPVSRPSPEARDQLYAELARDVEALERQGNILKRVVQLVKPTVVHIDANKIEDDGLRRRRVQEAGSGVIVDIADHKYILTNRHVISGTPLDQIKVHLEDSRTLIPTKLWNDKDTDLAVLDIDQDNLSAARLGDSDKLEIGDFVLAMGSPFGLSHSVTYGIISAKGRRDLSLGSEGLKFQDFIQTDAAINPGNSGGPLMSLRGEVVGINTAIASSGGGNEGIGFTIPINMAKVVATQLVTQGRVVRAFLGVHLDSRFGPEAAARLGLPAPRGAHVTGITPNSPAAGADVAVGDVILQFNGVRIEDDNHLVNLVSLTPVGQEIEVTLYRDGQPRTVKVRVGQRSDFESR
ncbi:MAG: trypsin-like peptidase domain-containing protein [Planctomycetales bacterium]|nr:trypsin-like peptidase domain-containing protein [Planctomycetales bacterium]